MKCPNCDHRMYQEDKNENTVNVHGEVQDTFTVETWWCPDCSYSEVR